MYLFTSSTGEVWAQDIICDGDIDCVEDYLVTIIDTSDNTYYSNDIHDWKEIKVIK